MKRKTSTAKVDSPAVTAPKKGPDDLATTVKMLPLQPGVYMLAVQTTGSPPITLPSGVRLPAITVSLAPGMPPDRLEFLSSPSVSGHWVSAPNDLLIVKVLASTTVAITSMRGPNQPEIHASFEKLGAGSAAEPLSSDKRPSAQPAKAVVPALPQKYQKKPGELGISILAHMRGKGDVTFSEVEWAGKIGSGHWIESYAVTPIEGLSPQDIEYKALTASGFESPWLSNSQPCGTRGMSIPIVGFAIRLKAGAIAAAYELEYSGYFQSGTTVGPIKNGAPCRSTIQNDPLEGLQIRVIRKDQKASPAKEPSKASQQKPAAKRVSKPVAAATDKKKSTQQGLLARLRKK